MENTCRYKESLFGRVDFWLDTHIANEPRLIDKETFFKGIEETIKNPFRVVPFFDPAPWGGQWMKEVCGLNPEKENYGWCFDCVPEENSLYFEVNGVRFELPSVDLVLLKSRELLGEPVEAVLVRISQFVLIFWILSMEVTCRYSVIPGLRTSGNSLICLLHRMRRIISWIAGRIPRFIWDFRKISGLKSSARY